MFIYKKLHAKTKRMMIPSLNEAEVWTQKNTKRDYRNVAAEKIIKSIGDDQKSSWIMNLEENSCRNHESLRQTDRNHEYQNSNDSASTPRRDQLILFNAPLPWQTQYIASFQLQRYVFFILYHKLIWKVLANIFFICHTKLKCGGRITPSSNRQDSNILINGSQRFFFLWKKKKNCSKEQGKRERQKKSWITVPFVKDIRSFSALLRTIFGVFFFTFY